MCKQAYKMGIKQKYAIGAGMACFLSVVFCTYALALWYGSRLIIKVKQTAVSLSVAYPSRFCCSQHVYTGPSESVGALLFFHVFCIARPVPLLLSSARTQHVPLEALQVGLYENRHCLRQSFSWRQKRPSAITLLLCVSSFGPELHDSIIKCIHRLCVSGPAQARQISGLAGRLYRRRRDERPLCRHDWRDELGSGIPQPCCDRLWPRCCV
jgi:hypothetical protein